MIGGGDPRDYPPLETMYGGFQTNFLTSQPFRFSKGNHVLACRYPLPTGTRDIRVRASASVEARTQHMGAKRTRERREEGTVADSLLDKYTGTRKKTIEEWR
jgi:hypothetical protein